MADTPSQATTTVCNPTSGSSKDTSPSTGSNDASAANGCETYSELTVIESETSISGQVDSTLDDKTESGILDKLLSAHHQKSLNSLMRIRKVFEQKTRNIVTSKEKILNEREIALRTREEALAKSEDRYASKKLQLEKELRSLDLAKHALSHSQDALEKQKTEFEAMKKSLLNFLQ